VRDLGWFVLFGATAAFHVINVTVGRDRWPALGTMIRDALQPRLGRALFVALWLWTGWHFFIRGWRFFLQGPGAPTPHPSGTSLSISETMTQVVLVLVALYALLAGVLVVGYRAWRAHGAGARTVAKADVAWERPSNVWRCAVLRLSVGYVVFVTTMGIYELLVGSSAHGIFGSALRDGAFLAFVVALPTFVTLSLAETALTRRAQRARGD
jgi:hypothetical protein